MFIYSRTATLEDFETLQVTKNIMRYAETKKNFTRESQPRYKFWDYSLAIELARQEKVKTILDIGSTNDITYEVLCNWHQINLKQITLTDFRALKIRNNQYRIITLLAQLEYLNNIKLLLDKVLKHISYNGFLVITTDEEMMDKHKKTIIDSEYLLHLSLEVEEKGFELYPYEAEYNDRSRLMSLVLKRIPHGDRY